METLPATAPDDSSNANPSSVKSDDSSPRHEGGCGSPPPNCAICLGTCRNKSFTDSCLHQFCFKCLLTWSKVKAECPLCKQNFRSIIHNVRSNHQYEEYMVVQRQTEDNIERIDIDSLTTAATRRFRYRTTLTLPRRDTIAFQQLLMHHQLMTEAFTPQLAVRRRRSPSSLRRHVYRFNLWARPLPDFTRRFRDCSPEFYRYNDSQMHRLVPWLNRELHYLLNENVGHITYVMARILELLPQHHLTSVEFRDAMHRYFGDRTEHFLHELYCFASSPYDMTGYDNNVQYTSRNNTRVISEMINEVISSSESEASVDSDIVMVSSSEPAEPPPGPSREPAPIYPHNYITQPPTHNNVIPIETISHSDTDDDSSEVMVVGYIKPPQDRTPEVVDLLGSDSDVIVQEDVPPEPQTEREPQDARPPLLLKLTLKKPNNRTSRDSDSDHSAYTPPPLSIKEWRRHIGNSTPSDGSRGSSETSRRSSSSSYSPSSYSSRSSIFSSSDSEESVKRKKRRKKTSTEKHKRKNKRASRSNHKNKKIKRTSSKEKQSKRKSHAGKGVKSTKLNEPSTSNIAEEQSQVVTDQPSTSGIKRKKQKRERSRGGRHSSRESKRLKSVVSVINNNKKSDESSPVVKSNPSALNASSNSDNQNENDPRIPHIQTDNLTCAVESQSNCVKHEDDYTDSEDDLPLNLTIAKSLISLSKM